MIKLNSYAKINLFLDINGKLKNGYHKIKTVMQSIDIYDEIILQPIDDNKIIIECSDLSIPINEKNTCYKAASILKITYGINTGIHISINKNIPQGAGMAGGSSNAAAVLKGLNAMWKLDLSEDEMCSIGAQIGADVPFCLVGGTCFAEGLGDKVTEIDDFVWDNILIVKPGFSISTAYVYQNTAPGYYNSYTSNDILKHISSHNYEHAARCVSNTLERVVEKFHPEINDIKKLMIDNGAVSSIMTGSGSAVFALFKDNDSLNKAYLIAKEIYPSTFKSKTCKYGVEFID
ncbi:MAG: 4-(cytidine 5'-diphospho)-2-C-methyl-D-erythritol kinase [Tissierellia bacterium]|nr:4-(cytidine 5'-diphospho)-2-C-methyl-D-erythritol kinase [Tissierellia bacterium]